MALWIRNPLTGLRRAPSARAGAAIVAGYLGLFLVANIAFGGDINFGDVLASSYNARHGLVQPAVVVLVFLIAVLSFLWWWRPVLMEARRSVPRWTMAVFAFGVAGPVADIVRADHTGGFAGAHRSAVLMGLVCIAVAEELAVRGALLVGLRDVAVESAVFFATTLAGAALQLAHFAMGERFVVAARAAATAVGIGALCYLVRRATGQLAAGAAVHALALVAVAFAAGPGAALGDATRHLPVGTMVAVGTSLVVLVLGRSVLFDIRVTIPRAVNLGPDRPFQVPSSTPEAVVAPKPWLGERKPF